MLIFMQICIQFAHFLTDPTLLPISLNLSILFVITMAFSSSVVNLASQSLFCFYIYVNIHAHGTAEFPYRVRINYISIVFRDAAF